MQAFTLVVNFAAYGSGYCHYVFIYFWDQMNLHRKCVKDPENVELHSYLSVTVLIKEWLIIVVFVQMCVCQAFFCSLVKYVVNSIDLVIYMIYMSLFWQFNFTLVVIQIHSCETDIIPFNDGHLSRIALCHIILNIEQIVTFFSIFSEKIN